MVSRLEVVVSTRENARELGDGSLEPESSDDMGTSGLVPIFETTG